MSIATTKNDQAPMIKEPMIARKISSAVKKICQSLRWEIFDLALIFTLIITGLGSLFGVKFPWYWITLMFLLIIIEVLLEFFCRQPVITETAEQNNNEHGEVPEKQ